MKISVTGGTGFVGRHIAGALVAQGHEVTIVAREGRGFDPGTCHLPSMEVFPVGLDNAFDLARAFAGCQAVAHCAGINREPGRQTYRRVHIEGTRNVIEAARHAGVKKIILTSFLRARPDCGSGYHESKWAAGEMVRASGMDYSVLKCGVIYGKGDHMLDHLSRAFHTFPVFAFVGFNDKPIRPTAVEDLVRIIKASVLDGALSRKTVAVFGPEQLTLRDAVRRVSRVVGRRPAMFPMPVWFHYLLGWSLERIMAVPMVSVAQVRILSEGLAEPTPPCDPIPPELAPGTPFSEQQIKRGLPIAGPFRAHDIRWCRRRRSDAGTHQSKRPFFEMP